MECPKCNTEFTDEAAISTAFTSNDREIDLVVTCPNCESEFYTFIAMSDLTPNE